MNKFSQIEHSGIVSLVEGSKITVSFNVESACASCHSKSMCTVAEQAEKSLEIIDSTGNFKPGDVVNIYMQKSMGTKAVLFAYFIPFILLLTSIIIAFNISENEGFAGLAGFTTLVIYYVILYLIRDKLARSFSFRIEKTS